MFWTELIPRSSGRPEAVSYSLPPSYLKTRSVLNFPSMYPSVIKPPRSQQQPPLDNTQPFPAIAEEIDREMQSAVGNVESSAITVCTQFYFLAKTRQAGSEAGKRRCEGARGFSHETRSPLSCNCRSFGNGCLASRTCHCRPPIPQQ